MNAAGNFIVGLREAFTLRHAEQVAVAEGDERRTATRRLVRAAKGRRASARRLASPVPAAILLRDALELARAATQEDPADLSTLSETVRRFLGSSSSLYLDDLAVAEAEALRDALDAEVTSRVGSLDTRTLGEIRALRWGRSAALALAAFLAVGAAVRAKLLPHDVALGKPVITNGARSGGPEVVDGRTRGTFGVYTNESPRPFVMVDLQKDYAITSIKVFNRGDGWFNDSLPLVLEISDDGVAFHELARRAEFFDVWTVKPPAGTRARFVRVAKLGRGYVALNEIEVFSRE